MSLISGFAVGIAAVWLVMVALHEWNYRRLGELSALERLLRTARPVPVDAHAGLVGERGAEDLVLRVAAGPHGLAGTDHYVAFPGPLPPELDGPTFRADALAEPGGRFALFRTAGTMIVTRCDADTARG